MSGPGAGSPPAGPGPHVCVLTSAHGPFDVRIWHKQCRALRAAGYRVTLVAPGARNEVVEGVRLVGVRRRASRLGRVVGTVTDVARVALRQRADLYHIHDPELIPVLLLLRSLGRRVCYDIHEDNPAGVVAREWIPRALQTPVRKVVAALDAVAASCASGVVAAEEEIQERVGRYNSRTIVLHNFPRLAEFSEAPVRAPAVEGQGIELVSFGGVYPERSAREMVEAMALLSDGESRARLVLVGRAQGEALVDELSASAGWSHVDWRGHLDREELQAVLRRAYAALVLFGPLPNHMRIRSNRFFEAMASGLPVVVPDFPAWRRFVDEHGVGVAVDPTDPADIARGIDLLLADPAEATRMGERGRRLFEERFNWDREQADLIRLYRSLT